MSCPFKYEQEGFDVIDISIPEDYLPKTEFVKNGEMTLMCDLRNQECVGESKCPIMKK